MNEKSNQQRPIMILFEVLGSRWTLRILWELRDGPLNFRQLRTRCDEMSPTSLNLRLKELRKLKLLALSAEGFTYTEWGRDLSAQLLALSEWSEEWAMDAL